MHHLNAQSWKKRIDWAFDFQQGRIKEIRGMFWEADELPDGTRETERVLEYPNRPALMAAMISDFRLRIDKPSFPLAEYPEFLHRIGKGMPYNMTYSLLVPMNVHMEMGESRITLRDYPLPLLHIPPIRPNQSPRTPSWSVKTDFVIAEESRDQESTRHVKVVVVPPEKAISEVHHGGFAIDVKRTASPVKTYSDVKIEVKTGYATKMTWANSYQPALQDMMQVIETFTKPQVDPSERPGFWDKIRLVFHSRLDIEWTGDGDVHLMLKGSRDPYVVTGYGAGFMMCWRNEVRWQICQDEDPRRFMTVNSGEYILAVPDYTHQARQTIHTAENVDTASTTSVNKSGVLFKKVIMKLTGNVQWQAGLVFERNVEGGGRSFDFAPHYDVVIKTPAFAKAKAGETYDAFRGFRSNHIHLSIAVIAPLDRDWSASNLKASTNYNSVHLTPRFFTHFFDWLSLFSGVMSLPVRQGSLWPGLEKTKAKKFGRHLATIKYKLLLSPLFIGHIYKHKDAEDYRENLVSATGLKIKLDSFMIDLHQRREENLSKDRKASVKTSHMRINQAQVDFISADIRAVSASIAGTTLQDLKKASEETLASYQQPIPAVDLSRFTIPDNDFSWIDMDDFVELDWILPTETNPKTQIMPLAFAPRFTYFRQTDHHDVKSGDPVQSSRLGDELTHFCVIRIQRDLIQERLEMLNRQMAHFQRALGEAELKVIRDANGDTSFKAQFEMLKHHGSMLDTQKQYLQALMENMSGPPDGNDYLAIPAINRRSRTRAHTQPHIDTHSEDLETAPLSEYANDFDNRFIVHNPQIKWHNTLRNIILRYIHQVNQRRGFVYYLSRRAVKFLLDIIMEQNKAQRGLEDSFSQSPAASRLPSIGTEDEDMTVEDRIQQLLRDAKKFVDADDPQESEGSPGRTKESAGEQLSRDYTSQNSYHIRLIAPQIQLQSEQNTSAAVLVAAKGMQLRIVQIMDRNRVADDVSGLVQRRFSADMNNVQIFVTNQKDFASQFLPMFSGKRYGAAGDGTWPPWLPLEVMFDYSIDPFGFSRVVQRTSASLRYDKYNTLRLKINEDVSRDSAGHSRTPHTQENHIDRIWVEFPRIRAICDSSQYYAIFVIVTDLLMFTEPLEKVRTDRLERIMLASDFSDLRGAPEMVTQLQQRIRQLEEIKMRFQLNARFLDRQGWEDRLTVEQDLAGCEDELFFMMKAITTSQRKLEDRSASNALLRWYLSGSEVVWRLTREGKEPLAEFQLENAVYDRIDNTDGSNHNSMHVDMILGFNLLSTATYPEMIAPYYDHAKQVGDGRDVKMLRVHWQKLEAIAGINVMDHFEVNLFPLKIQLEREVGKQIFEYIFPGSGSAMGPSSKPSSTVPSPRTPGPPLEKLIEHPALAENPPNDIPREEQEPSSQGRTLLMRLKPTLASSDHSQQSTPLARRPRMHSDRATQNGDLRSFHLFQTGRRSQSILKTSPVATPKSKRSMESLRMTALKPLERPSTSPTYRRSSMVPENSTRFSLRRGSTKEGEEEKDKGGSDELSQMMLRASNYMTLAYVKVPSVVLCLSYQGKGERNLEDLHNFVFRMPILEYRNKTWSNLELALRLKRDIIKALISHTGAIIGNKFAHHRPHKQHSGRVRELSSLSPAVVHVDGGGSSNDGATTASESSSRRGSSGGHTGLGADQSGSPAGRSLASLSEQGAGSNKAHSIPPTSSYASSMYSPGLGINAGNGGTTPSEKGSVFNSEGHFTSTAAVPIVTGDHADAAAAVAAAAAAPEGHHSFAHPKHILGKHLSHLGHLTIGRHAKDRVGGGGPSPGPSPGTRSGGAGPVPSPGVTTTITADEPEEHINSTSQPRRKGRHLLGKRILPSLGG
ncbi:MAG: hypothetical protein M1826_001733 [Phylliscum demangeonii]|nr:MAG: hypothetical protein M1826_001733 [Phylliscum demangeonii]